MDTLKILTESCVSFEGRIFSRAIPLSYPLLFIKFEYATLFFRPNFPFYDITLLHKWMIALSQYQAQGLKHI